MKKKLIKTLLIGATIGTALTGLANNRADACHLSHETIAHTHYPVELIIKNGEYLKKYKASDGLGYFYDYHPLYYKSGPVGLYYYDFNNRPINGFVRNDGDCYYFDHGKATSGRRFIDGHWWDFDSTTYKGHRID